MMRLIRKILHIAGLIWNGLGVALLVLFVAFVMWRRPREKEELRLAALMNRSDGPHVFWLDGTHARIARVRYDAGSGEYRPAEEFVSIVPGATWLKTAEGDLPIDPAGDISSHAAAPHPDAPARIAVISDIHGQYETMRRLLQRSGVIDAAGNWSWGANRLIVDGDVFDKGPSITEALWAIKRLERQARRSGGQAQLLLGNHDLLALQGGSLGAGKYTDTAAALGLSYAELFGPDTELGRWVRRQDVITRAGRWLFVHGGISKAFLNRNLALDEINRLARLRFDPHGRLAASISDRVMADAVWSRDGPLWYKGYFDVTSPTALVRAYRGTLRESSMGRSEAEEALRRYGCDRMVIGHTYTREIRALYGGKVIAICGIEGGPDTPGPATRAQILLIEGRRFYRLGLSGGREAI